MRIQYKILALPALLAALTYSCGDDSSEKSVELTDLNPPGALYSVTQDGALELRWSAANVEEDFKGYYVFGAKAKLSDILGEIKVPELTAAEIQGGAILERCKQNNAFFAAFGFKNSTVDCEGDDVASEEEESEEGEDDAGGALTNFVPCDGVTASADKLSLPLTPPTLSLQRCTVKQAWDQEEGKLVDIASGTDYVFFVVSVMGDNYDQVSWTSNIIDDVPSLDLLDEAVVIPTDKFVKISFAELTFAGDNLATVTASVSTPVSCPSTGDKLPCALGTTNPETDPAIYIARDAFSPTYPQRLFLSSGPGFRMTQQQVNKDAQAADQDSHLIRVRTPGDYALDKAGYEAEKTIFTVKDTNKSFDFVYTASNSKDYYGKVVFTEISYAGDSKEGDATLQVNIVLQPKADEPKYFR